MLYLLDTCAVSDFVKKDANTLNRLKALSPPEVKISVITAHELWYGLFRNLQMKKTTQEAVRGFLIDVEALPFTDDEATIAARIRVDLQKAGQPIGAYDLLIAATALVNKLTLVTSNEREFSRIANLSIENWRLPKWYWNNNY